MSAAQNRPEVSVIIPTRDSVDHLRRCLASLITQHDVTFEILVVDQGSSDGTREVALSGGAAVLDAPRPDVYGATTGDSRNLGAEAASGEYLLHLDSDMALRPRILSTAVDFCRGQGYVALILEEVDVTRGFWAECKALERKTYRGSSVLEAARFVSADVFRSVGGYDEDLGSAEDWDIHVRYAMRGSIGRLPNAVYHDLGQLSFISQLRKKFNYGRTSIAFLGKHDAHRFSRAMASAYRKSWREFAGEPLYTFGFAALRLGEVVALVIGMAVGILEKDLRRRRALSEGTVSGN